MLVELRDWKTRFTQPGISLRSGQKYDLTFFGGRAHYCRSADFLARLSRVGKMLACVVSSVLSASQTG